MFSHNTLLEEVKKNIPAYSKFLKKELCSQNIPLEFTKLPLQNKQNYLLSYPITELSRKTDIEHFHIIGASSGFSKTGAIYWPKRPCDEAGYMQSIESMLDANYNISKKRTLIIECLAFGMWIGGMQIATAIRNISLSGRFPVTIATPGLDLKAAINVIDSYKEFFTQILIITNPSNIPLFNALLKDNKIELKAGTISFPVVGEYFTESFREHVCQSFGHPIDSPYAVWTGYGSADAGDLGAETEGTIALRKYYHKNKELSKKKFGTTSTPMILAASNNAYIEIINNNIIVTKDQFIPLIRYNTGDTGGLINKEELEKQIPNDIYNNLPEKMIYVYGRADNAIIFYGTNLMITDIGEHFMSIDKEKNYGGLFTVHQKQEGDVTCFQFTVYVTDLNNTDKDWYAQSLIEFLCKQSAEFSYKYSNLSKAFDFKLIDLNLADIKTIDTKIKHKYII